MRSRYNVMIESDIKDTDGQNYPDPLSFPINNFQASENTIKLTLNKQDIVFPSKLMNKIYRSPEYDDIIFWLNDYPFIPDLEEGEDIELPTVFDLEDFLLLNR